jgi:TonB family protein
MKTPFILASCLMALCFGVLIPAVSAQNGAINSNRKVINRILPEYPRLARSMSLHGTVRLEVQVSEGGTVKSVQVRGGSPILVQSAQEALRAWKWEKAEHETTELVEFNFNP